MEELINRQQSLAFHFSGTQAACLPLNSPNIFTVTRSIFEFRTFWSSPVKSCILARSSWGNSTGPRLKKTWDRCRKLKDRYQRLDVIHIQSRQAHGTLFCVTIIPTYSKCWLISLNIYERNFQLIKYILFTIGPVICTHGRGFAHVMTFRTNHRLSFASFASTLRIPFVHVHSLTLPTQVAASNGPQASTLWGDPNRAHCVEWRPPKTQLVMSPDLAKAAAWYHW